MSVFELDTTGNQQALDDAQKNLFDTTKPKDPGFFDNFALAVGSGIMKGGARVGQAVGMAASVVPIAYDYLRGGTYAQDWYFKNVVDDIANNAVDYWTADAATTGTAGRTLGGLAEIALPLAVGGGNPAALIASQQIGTSTDLVKQGVDSNTALNVGLMQGASTAIGFRAPAAVGSSLGVKVGSGAAINVAIGGATEAMQHNQLQGAGYEDIAKQFDPMNIEGRSIDLLTGGVFGAMAHVQIRTGRPATPEQTDAILTKRNAQSFQRDTAPGIPADAQSLVAHQDAMREAFQQFKEGKAVDVAKVFGDARFIAPKDAKRNTLSVAVQDAVYRERPDLMAQRNLSASGLKPDVLKRGRAQDIVNASVRAGIDPRLTLFIASIETGGRFNADAKNPGSTAHGLFQVIDGTWKRFNGGNRNDVNEQLRVGIANLKAVHKYMTDKLGREIAPHEFYLGQLLGEGGAVRVLKADPNRPLIDVVREYSPKYANDIVRKNGMTGLTVGQAINKWHAATRKHLRNIGDDSLMAYADQPASRDAWRAEVEPMLIQGKKGESIGHADEIAAMYDRQTPIAERMRFDLVDDVSSAKLAEATGLDLSNYRYVIESNDIAQMRTGSIEAPQIEAMTRAEVMRIPEIVRAYDRASSVDNIIRLEKDDGNKTYVLDVERGKRELSVKRMRTEERRAPVNVPETVARNTSQPTQQPAPRQATPETTPAPGKVAAEPVATKSDSAPQAAEKTTQQPAIKNDVDLLRETVKRNPDAEVMLGFDDNGEPVRMKLSEALETIEADMQREIKDADGYMSAVTCMLARG